MRWICVLLFVGLLVSSGCDVERSADERLATGPGSESSYDSSKIVHLNMDNYEKTVEANDQVVLIDFWATWCGPCLRLAPTIAQLSHEYDGLVTVCKVDIDQQEELANQFKIQPIPAVFILKNGEVVGEPIIGMGPIEMYRQRLDQVLEK